MIVQYLCLAGHKRLTSVQVGNRGLNISAKQMLNVFEDPGILNEFIPEIFAECMFCNIVLGWAKASGENNEVSTGLCFFKGG